jgi:hypothetical protein
LSVHAIAHIDITDAERCSEYEPGFLPILAEYEQLAEGRWEASDRSIVTIRAFS